MNSLGNELSTGDEQDLEKPTLLSNIANNIVDHASSFISLAKDYRLKVIGNPITMYTGSEERILDTFWAIAAHPEEFDFTRVIVHGADKVEELLNDDEMSELQTEWEELRKAINEVYSIKWLSIPRAQGRNIYFFKNLIRTYFSGGRRTVAITEDHLAFVEKYSGNAQGDGIGES